MKQRVMYDDKTKLQLKFNPIILYWFLKFQAWNVHYCFVGNDNMWCICYYLESSRCKFIFIFICNRNTKETFRSIYSGNKFLVIINTANLTEISLMPFILVANFRQMQNMLRAVSLFLSLAIWLFKFRFTFCHSHPFSFFLIFRCQCNNFWTFTF